VGIINIFANINAEILSSRAIVGGFATMILLIATYNLFLSSKNIKPIILVAIYTLIFLVSLILISLAFSQISKGSWL
jgi:hypothetical protein